MNKPEHRIDGGTTYPPVFEVIVHGETVAVHDSALDAAKAFLASCEARGITPPDDSGEWWETSATWARENGGAA